MTGNPRPTKVRQRMRFRRPLARPAALCALVIVAAAPVALHAQAETYVLLARHAEKVEGEDRDPDLAAAGLARAASLTHALDAFSIEAVYASQFRRTQKTAGPLAGRFGLEVTVIDAGDVSGLVERIRAEGRPAVAVLGHSNTVPEIIRALGVAEAPEIPEYQYDDLFVVRLAGDGSAHLLRFKYGVPTPGR